MADAGELQCFLFATVSLSRSSDSPHSFNPSAKRNEQRRRTSRAKKRLFRLHRRQPGFQAGRKVGDESLGFLPW